MCKYCGLDVGHFGGCPNAEQPIETIGKCSLCGSKITTQYSEEYLEIEDMDLLICEKCLSKYVRRTDD